MGSFFFHQRSFFVQIYFKGTAGGYIILTSAVIMLITVVANIERDSKNISVY